MIPGNIAERGTEQTRKFSPIYSTINQTLSLECRGLVIRDALDFEQIPGEFFVRLWANRELGKSTVVNLPSSETGFTLLLSNDRSWILIDIHADGLACYYARVIRHSPR